MARTSKRYIKKDNIKTIKTIYNAGIYVRLSHERSEVWRSKSSSIEAQTLVCKEYALKENINVVNVYTDYEYTGTNFDRPKFQEMMQDIRDRKINCIIIRDLSRLGREYIEMGRLIDKVFPFLGVRFISVNDKLDTFKEIDSKKTFEITIKNIINDMYAKDISKKVIASKISSAKNGYYVGSKAPYGYKIKREKEGQKFIIDEKVSFIVKELFELLDKGNNKTEIARIFNKKGYATPRTYYNTGRVYRLEEDVEWHSATIYHMSRNKAYIGTLEQGKTRRNLSENKKQSKMKEEDYIVFENAHQPIISKELFDRLESKVKKKLDKKENTKKNKLKKEINIYKGLVIFYDTKEELNRIKYGKKYIFRTKYNPSSLKQIEIKTILEKDINVEIINKISEYINKISNKKSFMEKINNSFDEKIIFLNNKIRILKTKIEKEEITIQKTYEKFSLGLLTKDKYMLEREVLLSHIQIINNEINEDKGKIIDLKKEKQNVLKWLDGLYKAKKDLKLTFDLIHLLIENIIVYDTNDFEIVFKFKIDNLIGGAK